MGRLLECLLVVMIIKKKKKDILLPILSVVFHSSFTYL